MCIPISHSYSYSFVSRWKFRGGNIESVANYQRQVCREQRLHHVPPINGGGPERKLHDSGAPAVCVHGQTRKLGAGVVLSRYTPIEWNTERSVLLKASVLMRRTRAHVVDVVMTLNER